MWKIEIQWGFELAVPYLPSLNQAFNASCDWLRFTPVG